MGGVVQGLYTGAAAGYGLLVLLYASIAISLDWDQVSSLGVIFDIPPLRPHTSRRTTPEPPENTVQTIIIEKL
eukprot:1687658-Amphidinium_carterae.1